MNKMVKVKACGATVEIDPKRLTDIRVQIDMGKIARISNAEHQDVEAMIETYSHMMEVMFGNDMYKIMDDVADANGGVLDPETWGSFFKSIIESQTVKNS